LKKPSTEQEVSMNEQIVIPENEQYQELREFIAEYKNSKGALLNVLYKAQSLFGYLPREVQYFISRGLHVPPSQILGVITFYHFFRTQPVGKYVINLCLGTACHVKGAADVLKAVSKELKIDVGETTEDRLFTLSTARCFGACGLAPTMMVNEEIYGRLTPLKVVNVIKEIRERELNRQALKTLQDKK
jgi:NADH:ubiquinone oxidoreductase subunit E